MSRPRFSEILEAEGIHPAERECIRVAKRAATRLSSASDCIAAQPESPRIACAAGDREAAQYRRSRPRKGRRRSRFARGYIIVDDQLRTNVPGIWAMGDCNGKGGFTHTSYNDFEIVAANLLDNDPRRVSDRIHAYALYIDPPLGRAGHDRGRSPQVRPERAHRKAAHDQWGAPSRRARPRVS